MDRYTKGFVVASLVYFFLAAALGIWMGATEAPGWVSFAHIHFNLLGFMAMMIYGVGYFILPRFNAKTLKWPQWVPLHFYAANIGLVGMVITSSQRPSALFTLFALLNVASVAMFALNLGVTLVEPLAEEQGEPKEARIPPPREYITPDTRMGEILTRWPETIDILINNGFTPLKDPGHLEKVKSLPVTLGMACDRHGLDLDMIANLLNQAANALEREKSSATAQGATPPQTVISGIGRNIAPGRPITQDHVIGDILKAYPQTEKVFRKYYGAACFSCPGQATESIRQSALMHNVDEKAILADLNNAAGL
jgi:hybrid cluster-associated redox disulfide protein